MRLTQKVGNFFKRIGKGIKTAATKAYAVGKNVVGKVKEYAPKAFRVAKKVAEVVGSEKAKNVINKGESMYNKAYDKGKQIYDKGKQIYDAVKGG